MRQILFMGAVLALSAVAAFGSNIQQQPAASSDPSEITMILSGLGLVAVGLKRKPVSGNNAN